MASSFYSVNQNMFTRKFGTHTAPVEPYITGYHFCEWVKLPNALSDSTLYEGKEPLKLADIKSLLNGLTYSVNVPSRTINKTEIVGLGGVKWTAPTSQDEDTNISCRYLETVDLPIKRIMHAWTTLLRNNLTGTSYIESRYDKSQYSGAMYYWTVTPGGRDVQFYACYTGLWPTKDPNDSFSHDVAANDKLEIDIDYSFDQAFYSSWVLTNVNNFAERRFRGTQATLDEVYGQDSVQ